MDWGGAQATASLLGGQIACGWIYPPEDARDLVSPTVIAIRSFVQMQLVFNIQVFSGFAGMGIIRWNAVDSADSIVCPDPLQDVQLDWMARWVSPITAGMGSGTLLSPNVFDSTHLSKSKRKLENTSGLLLCWSLDADLATSNVQFASDHRFLVQQV